MFKLNFIRSFFLVLVFVALGGMGGCLKTESVTGGTDASSNIVKPRGIDPVANGQSPKGNGTPFFGAVTYQSTNPSDPGVLELQVQDNKPVSAIFIGLDNKPQELSSEKLTISSQWEVLYENEIHKGSIFAVEDRYEVGEELIAWCFGRPWKPGSAIDTKTEFLVKKLVTKDYQMSIILHPELGPLDLFAMGLLQFIVQKSGTSIIQIFERNGSEAPQSFRFKYDKVKNRGSVGASIDGQIADALLNCYYNQNDWTD